MRRRLGSSRRVMVATLVGLVTIPAVLPTVQPAGAQPAPDTVASGVTIAVESVTPWVDAEGTWVAGLTVSGAPSDARLTYSIRQPAAGTEADVRDALAASFAGEDEPKVMRRTVDLALADLTDTSGLTELEVPVRSGRSGDRDRVLIPNSGVYPVVITIESADGADLAESTLYLNMTPAASTEGADERPAHRLGILLRPELPMSFDDAGVAEITPTLRTTVMEVTDRLEEGAGLPLAVDLAPDAIEALARSEVPGDPELMDRLRREMETATVFRSSWADLHLEAWSTTGGLSDVQHSLVDGQVALFTHLGRPTDATLWPSDPTMGPSGVEMLTRLGITAAIVDPAQLVDSRPPGGESGYTRPFQVTGAGGTSLPAMALDPLVQGFLDQPTDDPALAAHRLMTLLFGAWQSDEQARGTILEIDDDARPEVVDALLEVLRDPPETERDVIRTVDPNEVTALPVTTIRQSGRESAWVRDLIPPPDVPDVSPISDRLSRTRRLVDDYRNLLSDEDVAVSTDTVLLQRSLDRRLPTADARATLDAVAAGITRDLGLITASEPRSVSLTSRSAPIPLRFTNGLDRPIQVILRLKSPRMDFLDGDEQRLTLVPGLNRIDVQVRVQTSGQFPMQAELLVPESNRVVASTRQRIQANTFSGVGLMLSGGALLFLVIWWSRTLRRGRIDATSPGEEGPPG